MGSQDPDSRLCIDRRWYIHITGHHSALKRKESRRKLQKDEPGGHDARWTKLSHKDEDLVTSLLRLLRSQIQRQSKGVAASGQEGSGVSVSRGLGLGFAR